MKTPTVIKNAEDKANEGQENWPDCLSDHNWDSWDRWYGGELYVRTYYEKTNHIFHRHYTHEALALIEQAFKDTISLTPDKIPALRGALQNAEVDGVEYLMRNGFIANDITEHWFMQIQKGDGIHYKDVPDLTVSWIDGAEGMVYQECLRLQVDAEVIINAR